MSKKVNPYLERYGAFLYPDLNAEGKQEKKDLLKSPVKAVVPSRVNTVADMIRAMGDMSIQARNVGLAYRVLKDMLADADRPTVLLGLAGPLIAGGLRQVIREMVEYGLVDVVVSTGAILYQDLYQARGYNHYKGKVEADDKRLRDLYIDRIYDTYVDEVGFGKTDSWVAAFADSLEPGNYSSRQFLAALGEVIENPLSILGTCSRRGVPVFAPALNDSSIGIGLTEHHHRLVTEGARGVTINSIQDNYELTQIIALSPATAAIYVAGGVPKNYINDSVVMSYIFGREDKGHRYAIQMSTAVTADGGLSSSTLDEAESWGKIRKGARRAMAWVEPTVALPLLVTAALQEKLHEGRKRLGFTWEGQLLKKLDTLESTASSS